MQRTIEEEDKWTCPSCEDEISTDTDSRDYRESTYANLSNREICSYCEESDRDHSSTMIRYLEDEKEVVRFGDEVGSYVDSEGDYDDDLPEWFTNIFTKREYHHTDGWRGYYDTQFKGLTKLADGWLTGYPDSTKRETTAINLDEALRLGKIQPPKPLYWLFEPTSNVFSMASTIFVAEEDREEMEEWLTSEGFGIMELDRAFA
jgi:hypothetical protein